MQRQENCAVPSEFINEFVKNETVIAISALMAIIVAWAAFYKQIGKPIVDVTLVPIGKFFYGLATVSDNVKTLSADTQNAITDLSSKVDLIAKEMKTNGGSTLKDHLMKIDSKLSIAEGQRHLVLNQGILPYFMTDAQGQCTWANTAFLELTNLTLTEVLGNNWINVSHGEDKAKVIAEWADAISHKRDFNFMFRFQPMDRSGNPAAPFMVHVLAYPSFNHMGMLVGYNGIVKKSSRTTL